MSGTARPLVVNSEEVTDTECPGPVLGWDVTRYHGVVDDYLPVDRRHRQDQAGKHRNSARHGSEPKTERLQDRQPDEDPGSVNLSTRRPIRSCVSAPKTNTRVARDPIRTSGREAPARS